MSGGSLGSGIGGALGTGLGMLLAPETGGASLAIPAALGAVGGAGGAALSGGNPLTGGLLGGAGGLSAGFLSGLIGAPDVADAGADAIANPLDLGTSEAGEAANAVDPEGLGAGLGAEAPGAQGAAGALPSTTQLPGTAGSNTNSGSWLSNILGNTPTPSGGSTAAQVAGSAATKGSSGLSDYLLPAGLGLGVLGALMPGGSNPTSVSGTANSVAATTPGFTSQLPTYQANVTQTPYQGSWYTYGLRPEAPLVQSTLTPTSTPITSSSAAMPLVAGAAKGGLIHNYANGGAVNNVPVPQQKPPVPPPPQMPPMRPLSVQDVVNALPKGVIPKGYASGGHVYSLQIPMSKMPIRKMAMGGQPMPVGPQMPPQAAPMPSPMAPQQRPNPVAQQAQFQLGQKLGQALRHHIRNGGQTPPGPVHGPGKGQQDAIPAKLSQGEYIIPADIVSHLGDGSSQAGGQELDKMVHAIRAQKTKNGAGFPPASKGISAYLGNK
jgi:hypothetical protein